MRTTDADMLHVLHAHIQDKHHRDFGLQYCIQRKTGSEVDDEIYIEHNRPRSSPTLTC